MQEVVPSSPPPTSSSGHVHPCNVRGQAGNNQIETERSYYEDSIRNIQRSQKRKRRSGKGHRGGHRLIPAESRGKKRRPLLRTGDTACGDSVNKASRAWPERIHHTDPAMNYFTCEFDLFLKYHAHTKKCTCKDSVLMQEWHGQWV